MAESVLVFCAHPDDEVFGAGGTVAKYSQEGKEVRAVVFTVGEQSHPWRKEEVTYETRIKESKKAASILGYKECIFLGVPEANFLEEIEETDAVNKVKELIKKHRPNKILTHSINDHHPIHRAVHRIVKSVVSTMRKPPEVYAFDIWTVISLRERNTPRLIVDVTDTFSLKISALKSFKSQQVSLISLLWSVYLKAWLTGLKNNCRYAEAFDRVAISQKEEEEDA